MSYLTKEKIEETLSVLYSKEKFIKENHEGKKIILLKDISNLPNIDINESLKLRNETTVIPYSVDRYIDDVIEYFEKYLPDAMTEEFVASRIKPVDTSDWKAEDVYPSRIVDSNIIIPWE
jgi:hypothetical protein|tara:strand:+ start:44 stop:403 length:360 start_codon:yes stop_codon:yes gene_type:complete